MITAFGLLGAFWCLWYVAKSLVLARPSKQKESSPDGLLQSALRWLEDNNYDVLNAQKKAGYTAYVGDSLVGYKEEADFIARKNGHEYAVIVGLEDLPEDEICGRYFPLFTILDVQGIIFLNMRDESVRHVEFKLHRPRRYQFRHLVYRSLWFSGGIVFAFALLHRA
ncbi:hypothetical protein [Alicyclobacillus fastidiosus]|uniref:Uncharacterized protein n=1 Tax=Alicyclobacillus fastidiosus TaxID=392011 RepID=A0ABV5AFZ2_9BACL|nr:hypothetical protein [Alicyclobacillus fastidiosus]WEH11727.1 hypothetical protein PYS47_11210 [Alicyclobacillus fastidiosus]